MGNGDRGYGFVKTHQKGITKNARGGTTHFIFIFSQRFLELQSQRTSFSQRLSEEHRTGLIWLNHVLGPESAHAASSMWLQGCRKVQKSVFLLTVSNLQS